MSPLTSIRRFAMCSLLIALPAISSAQTFSDEIWDQSQYTASEFTKTDSLSLFDSNLGTLTGARIYIFAAIETQLDVVNHTQEVQEVGFDIGSAISWSSGLSAVDQAIQSYSTFVPGGTMTSGEISLASVAAKQLYVPNDPVALGPYQLSSGVVEISLDGILGDLTSAGGGSFDLTVSTENILLVRGAGGNFQLEQETNAAVWAKVEYDYVPVPEPHSMMLLGLFGFLALSRHRR